MLNDFDLGKLSEVDKAMDDLNRIERKNKIISNNNKIKDNMSNENDEEEEEFRRIAKETAPVKDFCENHHDDSCSECRWGDTQMFPNAQRQKSGSQGNPLLNKSSQSTQNDSKADDLDLSLDLSNVSSSSKKSSIGKPSDKKIKLSPRDPEKTL